MVASDPRVTVVTGSGIGRTQDMAEACMFLLSDDSSYLLGQDLRVNGGSALW